MDDKKTGENLHTKINRRSLVKMMGAMSLATIPTSLAIPAERQGQARTVLTFLTLKEAKQSRNIPDDTIVQTMGYYTLNDGGGTYYHISKDYNDLTPNDGDVILFPNNRVGIMVDRKQVNYQMFGAVGDGKNDDGIQIKMAHEYANKHQIAVSNHSGEYWIEETRNIPIQSTVNFGESIFHINERLNTKAAVFRISSRFEAEDIVVDPETKSKIVSAVKPGMQQLPELKEYKNSLISIVDQDDRIGFRAGARYKGQSWAREELFYLEEDGRVVGDIAWAFKDYTSLKAYPAEQSYLVIEGGTFYLSGDNHPEPEKKGYFQNGFSITRSRTIIRNQWVGLEKGKSDIAFNPRNGFYSLNRVYDVTLENIRLVPWEQDREGTERDLYAGTYGIGAARVMNCTFRNITAEGTMLHWGVFGTNLNKNFRIERCQLNRIDVHFHCWNLTIQDSQIGNRGISITGGGELIIENTSCSSQNFVNFRYDFGAKWEGTIYINNCQLKPNRAGDVMLLRFVAANADYRYPIGLADKIHIRDFVVDFSTVPQNDSICWLIKTSPFSETKYDERLFFPKSLICKDITVKGREKGIRLMQIVSPETFSLPQDGGYDGSFVQCNSSMQFDNIQLEKIEEGGPEAFHLHIQDTATGSYNDRSLYPYIHFSNCDHLFLHLGNAICNVLVENCSVAQVQMAVDKNNFVETTWMNCRFLPKVFDISTKPYQISAKLGTSFVNCVFHLPRYTGELKPELLNLVNIVQLNKAVKYNHLNSRLGSDILDYCKQNAIVLTPGFINMLKSHHELEAENV